jgi:hypothetical protein
VYLGTLQKEEEMVLKYHRRTVNTFINRQDAERALHKLEDAGFQRQQIYIVAEDLDTDASFSEADGTSERTASCGTVAGSMVGAICGCLVGLGILAVPGVGLVATLGTSGAVLATTLAGAGIGTIGCGLIETLAGLGFTEAQAREYIKHCKYLVMLDGTDDEVRRAESVLTSVSV